MYFENTKAFLYAENNNKERKTGRWRKKMGGIQKQQNI